MNAWIINNQSTFCSFWPELFLAVSSFLILLGGAFLKPCKRRTLWVAYGVLGLYLALSVYQTGSLEQSSFSNMWILDGFSLAFKTLFVVLAVIVLYLMFVSKETREIGFAEQTAFVLSLVLGLTGMSASGDLLMMVISLEWVSILSYIMVGHLRKNTRSSEAGMKYLIFGAVASGVMLYGFSFLFGLTGSTDLVDIKHAIFNTGGISTGPALGLALLCILIGVGYKIAAFPSHMWCPDVYEGAPLPVTTFLSVGPKAAGLAMLMRFLMTLKTDGQWAGVVQFIGFPMILGLICILTMTVGNLGALLQTNLKRFLAYSSIAHAGYLLMGTRVLTDASSSAVVFYLFAYLLMNVGAFMVVHAITQQTGDESIDQLKGFGWTNPELAALFTLFLVSLIGLPPCVGFIGKFLLFSSAIKGEHYILATAGIVNSVIALVYYARVIKVMYFDSKATHQRISVTSGVQFLLWILAIPTVVLGLFWSPMNTGLPKLFAAPKIEETVSVSETTTTSEVSNPEDTVPPEAASTPEAQQPQE